MRLPLFISWKGVLKCNWANILMSLKENKVNSLHVIPVRILKSVANSTSTPLSTIINQAISEGIYPSCLKTSKVFPIFKFGDKTDGSNYRPISILSDINKLCEKLIYSRLYHFIIKNNILSPHQFGFQRNKSTSDAVIIQLQYLYDNIDTCW